MLMKQVDLKAKFDILGNTDILYSFISIWIITLFT